MTWVHFVGLAVVATCLQGCDGPSQAERRLAERLNAKAGPANARVRIPYNPASDAVVSDAAYRLVGDYGMPLAFEAHKTTAFRGRDLVVTSITYDSHQLIRHSNCRDPSLRGPGFRVEDSNIDGYCKLLTEKAQPAKAILVDTKRDSVEVDGERVSRYRLIIRTAEGKTAQLLYFQAGNGGEEYRYAPLLASAFGLREGVVQPAGVPDLAQSAALMAQSRAKGNSRAVSALEQLATTGSLPRDASFSIAELDKKEIANQAEPMIRQFEAHRADPHGHRISEQLPTILAHLPMAEWKRYAPRLLKAVSRNPDPENPTRGPLIARLTDQGAAAAQVYATLFDPGLVPFEYAAAACLIGPKATPAYQEAIMASWRAENRVKPPQQGHINRRWRGPLRQARLELCQKEWAREDLREDQKRIGPYSCWVAPQLSSSGKNIYLALRRMGLGAEADSIARHKQRVFMERDFRDVGPHSSPDVCEMPWRVTWGD